MSVAWGRGYACHPTYNDIPFEVVVVVELVVVVVAGVAEAGTGAWLATVVVTGLGGKAWPNLDPQKASAFSIKRCTMASVAADVASLCSYAPGSRR